MVKENTSQQVRLKNIEKTRKYFVEEIEQNELMSNKHRNGLCNSKLFSKLCYFSFCSYSMYFNFCFYIFDWYSYKNYVF